MAEPSTSTTATTVEGVPEGAEFEVEILFMVKGKVTLRTADWPGKTQIGIAQSYASHLMDHPTDLLEQERLTWDLYCQPATFGTNNVTE